MSPSSLLEAFDAVAHSEVLLARLGAAQAELSRKQGLKDEKAWLSAAVDRVTHARAGVGDLLTRVLRLPQLEALREEHARTLQQAAVDAVERLQAGITFHGGSRAPLLETLFAKLKLPALRRVGRADFEKFCADFERRLNGSYVKRMLADATYAPLAPALTGLRAAFATWRGAFSPEPLAETEARALMDELDAAARRLELPLRQARLLAEAACAPVKDLYESSGLAAKPKKRTLKAVVTEAATEDSTEEAADERLDDAAPGKRPHTPREKGAEPVLDGETASPAKKPRVAREKKPAAEAVAAEAEDAAEQLESAAPAKKSRARREKKPAEEPPTLAAEPAAGATLASAEATASLVPGLASEAVLAPADEAPAPAAE
ncbi:MAG: hypothetical protein AB1730_26910 [Myxococcota bacterium]